MFCNTEVAYKYKMSSMQAALGLAQLERVEELVARKREIFAWYREELKDVRGLILNPEPAGTKNSYWMVTVILDPEYHLSKRDLMDLLALYQPRNNVPLDAATSPGTGIGLANLRERLRDRKRLFLVHSRRRFTV